ncbi:hypothetical protein vBKpPHS106_35 [Klebsiella phage VB_KpP_HS106]|nr:hypothetical protein vBKpPHS106_35 [Klebsiella phage VB_KpP_HS106]
MKEDCFFAFVAGGVLGVIIMGLLMSYVGPNSKDKVDARKAECELNIPRNQSCIMQFVPEKSK